MMHFVYNVFTRSRILGVLASGVLLSAGLTAGSAYAESASWSGVYGGSDSRWADSGIITYWSMNIAVSYGATITNAVTGVCVCGEPVPKGTPLILSMHPHVPADIWWTAMGGFNDTPYGNWSDTLPPAPLVSEGGSMGYANIFYELGGDVLIRPPAKDIQVSGDTLACEPQSGNSRACVAAEEGSTSVQFVFAPTQGVFSTGGNPWEGVMTSGGGGFSVPQRVITIPVQVTAAIGNSPNTPSVISGGAAGSGAGESSEGAAVVAGACTIGAPYFITVSASDPDNDDVRYGIDWDADGSIDQFAPSEGHVPSGTAQSISRTYATAGTKTVRAAALDSNGLMSTWVGVSFTCAEWGDDDTQEAESGSGENGGSGSSSGTLTPTASLRATPSLVRSGERTTVRWDVSNVTSCSISGSNGDEFSDIALPSSEAQSSPILERTVFTLSCESSGGALVQSATVHIVPQWSEM